MKRKFEFIRNEKAIGDFFGGCMKCLVCKKEFTDIALHNSECNNKFDFGDYFDNTNKY